MAEKNIVWLRQKDVDDLGQDAGWCNVYRYEPAPPSRGGTLVLHDGPHERVFTESEVRAMMDDVKAIAAEHSRNCYTNHIEQMTPPAPVAFHIDNYLWKSHGFSSDPA